MNASVASSKLDRPKLNRRPPKTSREEIIDMALVMLREKPEEKLSIHKLANRLNITPRAFYNHLENKNALMQAVAKKAFSGLKLEPVKNTDWRVGVRDWAHGLRDYFNAHPYLITLLAWEGHVSSSWLEQQIALLDLLPRSPVASNNDRVQAMQWVIHSVLGFLLLEIGSKKVNPRIDPDDISGLNAQATARMKEILPAWESHDQSALFDFNLTQLIAALQVQIDVCSAAPFPVSKHGS